MPVTVPSKKSTSLGDILKVEGGTALSDATLYYVVTGIDTSMDQLVCYKISTKRYERFNREDPALKHHASPVKEWLALDTPLVSKPLIGVRALIGGRTLWDLGIGEDWVPSDFTRKGGVIFVNPRLKFAPGDVLTLVYEGGKLGKITIPAHAKTVTQKVEVAARKATLASGAELETEIPWAR